MLWTLQVHFCNLNASISQFTFSHQLDANFISSAVVSCLLISSCLCDDPSSHLIAQYGEDLVGSYSDSLPGYSEDDAAAAPMSGIDMLRMSVPGNPGQESRTLVAVN